MEVKNIKRVAVVGAGLMGHGIAQEFAMKRYKVCLYDCDQEQGRQAINKIKTNLRRLVSFGLATHEQCEAVPARIRFCTIVKDAVADVDLVVEAVYENLELKQKIFQELDSLCPARTIFASNTSTLHPSDLAAVTRRPDKVLVVHYLNPPYLIPLVEIVRSEKTSDETVMTICHFLEGIGKRPVTLRKEVPGFIANRLQVALLREALWLVHQGIASAQDVDTVIKTSFGRRWAAAGVFEVFEIAGWDLLLSMAETVVPTLASSSEMISWLREKVDRGELGVKSGKGFYEWTPESVEALSQRIAHALVQSEKWPRSI